MIQVKFSDLLTEDVDVIVNPANSYMLHGGGLAAVIARKAGYPVVKESQACVPEGGVPTGQGILTFAGKLPQKAIIHIVGPVYNEAENNPDWRKNNVDKPQGELLADAYRNSVSIANEHGYTSIAFPAVSCGVFRYPVEEAAPIAIAALREAQSEFPRVEDIRICLLDDNHYNAFLKATGLDIHHLI